MGMSGITAQIQKEKTEKMLNRILAGSEYTFYTDRKINTPIKLNGKNVIDIYYRVSEIRINIRNNSLLYNKYKELKKEGVAYQKVTADPGSTIGVFAFFVSEDNAEYALKVLLGL